LTLLFLGFLTQQILDFGLPHVLRASHLSTGFLQVGCSVASLIAPLTISFAHFTYFLCDSAPLQSQAADTTARTFSMAVRSVHLSLLQTAPAAPCSSNTIPRAGATRRLSIIPPR